MRVNNRIACQNQMEPLPDMTETVRVKVEGKWYTVEVYDLTQRPVRALVDGHVIDVEVGDAVGTSNDRETRTQPPTTRSKPAPAREVPAPTVVDRPEGAVVESPPDPNKVFSAPMPGTILSIQVKPGDQVVTGDVVCVLEAMKMQQQLRADWSGVVKSVLVSVGQQVMDGAPIVEIE